ncbi:hydrolase [Sulfurimonas sp.]|uniref:hydrolase n=1 Tax=Sulfurimonas sp. TaxID=2022749 RepID=UPI00261B3D7B|nr:hydrolase [Sulfurimonas sp.]
MNKQFKPALGLKNGHLQTIYATFFRKLSAIHFEREKFILSDGDFVECFWHKIQNHQDNTPIVTLFHGLAGSYKSPYIQGTMQELQNAGFSSVLMHFRGCGDEENAKARSYHSGDTQDAFEFIQSVKKRYPKAKLFAVGYSLGANMLLKLLGEKKEQCILNAAVGVSPPLRLDICATHMNSGFAKIYQAHLLKDLNAALLKKYKKFDMQKLLHLKEQEVSTLDTFWKFDDAYTAPVHGFGSAKEYYEKSSARQYLKQIHIPTLIIHAKDDPFMTPEVLPNAVELSESISLEVSEHGGHVGFISGSFLKPQYWMEKRVVEFFKKFN